jgi:hypothetical protein
MSRTIIKFVDKAVCNDLPFPVIAKAAARGVPVNALSICGWNALHAAVHYGRRDMVAALLAVGADPNAKTVNDETRMLIATTHDAADILQLLICGGGNINDIWYDRSPLISLVIECRGDRAARHALLACPELKLDVKCEGRTAEQWAVVKRREDLAEAIANERLKRQRWNARRLVWVAATISLPFAPAINVVLR